MRVRVFALLMLGAVIALTAGGVTFSYTRAMEAQLMSAQAAIEAFGKTRRVPVAALDIPRGKQLSPEDFASLLIPEDQLPPNVLRELPVFSEAAPPVALSDVGAGALLLQTSIGHPHSGGVGDLLKSADGRAVSVAPKNLGDYRDVLALGDTLDLYWTIETGGAGSETRLIGNALRLAGLPIAAETLGGTVSSPPDHERLLLDVGVRDAARILAAGQTGVFHILPSRGPLSAGADVVEMSDAELAALPLVTRARAALPATIPDMKNASEQLCSAVVVRAGHRMEVQVPC